MSDVFRIEFNIALNVKNSFEIKCSARPVMKQIQLVLLKSISVNRKKGYLNLFYLQLSGKIIIQLSERTKIFPHFDKLAVQFLNPEATVAVSFPPFPLANGYIGTVLSEMMLMQMEPYTYPNWAIYKIVSCMLK